MFETRHHADPTQTEFWIPTDQLPQATGHTFYRKLDQILDSIGFFQAIRDGRPGIDLAVYFKRLMIGFFENLPSEWALASRCADSLSLRAFLGYRLTDSQERESLVTKTG